MLQSRHFESAAPVVLMQMIVWSRILAAAAPRSHATLPMPSPSYHAAYLDPKPKISLRGFLWRWSSGVWGKAGVSSGVGVAEGAGATGAAGAAGCVLCICNVDLGAIVN